MTSKTSFTRILREDMKRRVWSLALSLTGFFFALPVIGFSEAESLTEDLERRLSTLASCQEEYMTSITGAYNFLAVAGLVVMALICGIHGMKYLHSRQEADFYGAIPVLRTTKFKAAYINGILITVIPYMLMHILSAVVGLSRGFVTGRGLAYGAATMLVHGLLYVCTYSVIVIAAVLTGHIAVSVAASGVLLFGLLSYAMLFDSYADYFFMTRYSSGLKHLLLLSPVTAYGYIAYSMNRLSLRTGSWVVTYVLIGIAALIISVVLYFAGRGLIKIRRAETAGRAMSFEKTRPWIKIIIMVPVALVFGLLFSSMSSRVRIPWLIFGLAAGIILSHAVIEMIYEFDFRACRKHILSSLAGAAVTALIAAFFVLDLSSYETRLPDQNSVESAAIYMRNVNDIGGYGGYAGYLLGDDDPESMWSTEETILNTMEIKDMDSMYVLAKAGAEFAGEHRMKRYEMSNYYSYPDEYSEEFDGMDLEYITVNMRRRSGREFKRNYIINIADEAQMAAVTKLCESKEFIEAEYPVTKGLELPEKYILGYETSQKDGTLEKLSADEGREIVDALAEETAGISMHTMQYEVPVGLLNIQVIRDPSEDIYNRIDYYTLGAIYPSFTETISLLEKAGVDMDRSIDTDEIDHIEIVNYDDETGEEQAERLSKAESEKVLPDLVDPDYASVNTAFCKVDYEKNYRVCFKDETERYYYCLPGKGLSSLSRSDDIL